MSFLRIGICGLLAFAVLAFGGTEEWSQAVLETVAALLLVAWSLRLYLSRRMQVNVPEILLPLCGFLLVAATQLVFHRTASPYSTRVELQLLLMYVIVLFLISQAYTQSQHWRGLLWFLMSLGFFVSIFGILQQLTFNGTLYWVREMHYGGLPFGPYANRNHFAGFAELVIPVALVPLVLGKVRRERLFLVALFATVPIIALLLSASRGGILSFGVEMVILFSLLILRKARGKFVIVGGAVVVTAVLAVSWIGIHQMVERFSELQRLEVTPGKRTAMRRDTWRLFLDHPALGTGLGTFQMVYPPYDSAYDGRVANHAHNDYLEALAETGVAGGVCCAWFLGVLLLSSLRGLAGLGGSFNSALNLSGLVGCCGILVHSLVDFNLHIPANALLFFVSAHLATVYLQPAAPAAGGGYPGRERVRKP